MTAEKLIEQILSMHSEISREEILDRLEREKAKTGGLISHESLLRMIAAELGVKISLEASSLTLPVKSLVSGLGDVTIVGQVVAVFPSRTFKGDKNGKFASLFIADKSDMIRVVLWDDKASLTESDKLKVGQIVRVSHGYTREDRSEKVELHIGDKGEIEINPQDVQVKDYPTISRFLTKIGKITQEHRNKKVNVTGTIKGFFSPSTFKRQDSSSGKVMRVMLADETGEIPVVVWNEKVDEVEKVLRKGIELQIVNAKVKKAVGEGLEIHVNAGTYVEVLATTDKFLKIADVKEGLNNVNVEGVVVTKPIFREVKTSKSELVKLAVLELKDETGRIWVSAWREHADSIKCLKIGDKILVKNVRAKKGFGGQLELSTKNVSSILLFSENAKKEQN